MWEQNVKALVWCAPDQLLANPRNARRHPAGQRDALREMIDRVGFAAPVIVNTVTGFVIDGHARIEEALTAGIDQIPVVEVELTELQEKEFLAGFDATTLLASYDPQLLTDLVNDIPLFDAAALQGTLESLARLYSGDNVENRQITNDEIEEPIVTEDIETSNRCPACEFEW